MYNDIFAHVYSNSIPPRQIGHACLESVEQSIEVSSSLTLTFHIPIFYSSPQQWKAHIIMLQHHHLPVVNPPLRFGKNLIRDTNVFLLYSILLCAFLAFLLDCSHLHYVSLHYHCKIMCHL